MSDVEKKHRKNLKNLIADAGAALEDLDAPAVQNEENVSEATAEAADKVEWQEQTASLDFREGDIETSREIEMIEDDGGITPEEAIELAETTDLVLPEIDEARISKLQALADRVAKTRAENEGIDPDGQMGFTALEEELDAAENDGAEEPTEFIENDQLISIIESLLFSTDKPVSVASIKMIFKGTNVRTKDISRALDLLASDYAASTRGVSLEEINGGYQLRTKSDNADFLKRLAKVRPFKLSGPALEVMAIVAYKQPVTKHEVDEIRGVESGHLMRALMERGMVCFQGKSDLPGRPMAYGTTRKFLETFGLRNIRELPTLSEIDELLPEGIGEVEEEKEVLSDLTERLSNEITASYSEGEEELGKINEQLKAVDTTTEFFEQEKVRERERRDREKAKDLQERIMLGETLEKNDQRWLDRYEAKLAAPPVEAQPSASELESAETTAAVAGELASLSEDAFAKASSDLAADNAADEEAAKRELLEFNEDIGDDDLSVNMDWDEDSESEKDV